jgi:hypothetical protein
VARHTCGLVPLPSGGRRSSAGTARVGEATLDAGVAVEVGVGELGAHLAGREANQGEMAAGGEGPVEQGEVADAAVRWQVVEAAGIVDQVVRSAQVGRGEGEGVAG